jgi:hypothetical protein
MEANGSWSLNRHASDLHINLLLITESNIKHREEKMITMASKDNNKHKYSTDIAEEEAEEAPPKKQVMIGSDDHGNDSDNRDDHGDDGDDEGDDDGDSSFSSIDDDYSSEPEEDVSSEEEMNIPTNFDEKLLIR